MTFNALVSLAGYGPVAEPQVCRSCGKVNLRAMLLDCLHSFCGSCYAASVAACGPLTCPTCGLLSHTHDREPYRDYVADHFLAVSDMMRTEHVCAVPDLHDDSGTPEPATFYCVECSTFMCSICAAAHRQDTSAPNHATVMLEDLTPDMVRMPVVCPYHGDGATISGYCWSCHQGVCPACIPANHIAHDIITHGLETSVYLDVCNMLDAELAHPLSSVKSDAVAMTLLSIDACLSAGSANVRTQLRAIDEWACHGAPATLPRAQELRSEVESEWAKRQECLATQRTDVARRVHAFSHAVSYGSALRRVGAALEVVMVGAFVARRISALGSWLHAITPCVSNEPVVVILSEEGSPLGRVAGPRIRPWQQGWPPLGDIGTLYIYAVGGTHWGRP